MSYLNFNKAELVNLEYSLQREVLSTNRTGGYCNTTIVGCNTRKYHGLFVLPVPNFEGKNHLLLSAVDETLIQHDKEFNLGIRSYGDIYEPRGHKYIVDFELDRACTITYRVGGMIFTKSLIFIHNKEQLLIKYTLVDAHSHTVLRLKPFLAFRETHSLTHANPDANTRYETAENGCSYKMYEGFPDLFLQTNKKADYVHTPDWYKNVVYREEERRGFDHSEDLFVPGFFEMPIAKGESIILSVSTSEENTRGLKRIFDSEEARRRSRSSYEACLKLAARQFFIYNNGESEICAGYSWLGKGLRETLISLPGLTLYNDGDIESFDNILNSTLKIYSSQLFNGSRQAEAALWLFWLAQQYASFIGDDQKGWLRFKDTLKKIAKSFIGGGRMGVSLNSENGMLWTKMNDVALSWMNAYGPDGKPVTERGGYQVETNALWYNALSYLIEKESMYGKDRRNVKVWKDIRAKIEADFYNMFWVEERAHLADYVDENGQNKFTRPNQLIACILDYSPINEEVRANVLRSIKRELLTARGIRTLSPKNPLYKGVYEGNQHQRDMAYHQGCTRTWLLGFYIDASLRLFGGVSLKKAQELVDAYEEDMTIHGIGSIAELYDGDPPHHPHGAVSHSVAVAELLRARYLISNFKEEQI